MMYRSKFSPFIIGCLDMLHNMEYKVQYLDSFYALFDDFCVSDYPTADVLTKEIAESWIASYETDSKHQLARCVNAMKHLGEYQCSLGISAYIPQYSVKRPKAEEPRLFSDAELKEFFHKVDNEVRPTKKYPFKDKTYPVLFRMLYCCGLRTCEAFNLTVDDVDLETGKLRILQSKNLNDREIYMSDDMLSLCRKYDLFIRKYIPYREYFFVLNYDSGRAFMSPAQKDFFYIYRKTSFYSPDGKNVSPHGLRHLFAVHNIRKCAELGENFDNWIQYLSRYMGHKAIRYTYYYVHLTSHLFPIYKEKLAKLEERIGVLYVEED